MRSMDRFAVRLALDPVAAARQRSDRREPGRLLLLAACAALGALLGWNLPTIQTALTEPAPAPMAAPPASPDMG